MTDESEREDEFGMVLAVVPREGVGAAELARVIAAELLKTLVKHRHDGLALEGGEAVGERFGAAGTGEDGDEFEGEGARGGFGVDERGDFGGVGGETASGWRRERGGGGGPGGKVFADGALEFVGREIADGEDDGVVGAIPGFVEGAEIGGVGGGDDGFVADGIAGRVEVVGMDETFAGGRDAGLPVVARAALALDDAAFAVERGGVEGLFAGEFAEDDEGLVEACAGGIERDVDLVDGVRGKRERGGVGAEGDAVPLQGVDERVTGKTARAGEAHVFDEVGEAELVFVFVQRAGEDEEAEGDVVARLGVGEDEKPEAVGERAEAGVGVRREVAGLVRPRGGAEGDEREQNECGQAAAEVDHRRKNLKRPRRSHSQIGRKRRWRRLKNVKRAHKRLGKGKAGF